MQRADLTTRVIAAFVDLLIVIGLARFPDVLGVLAASGYILVRDGLFGGGRSVGKKLVGLRVVSAEGAETAVSYRESVIRNAPLAAACILVLIPYVGWILTAVVAAAEGLTSLGDERGMRIGDMLARTMVVKDASGGAERTGEETPEHAQAPEEEGR